MIITIASELRAIKSTKDAQTYSLTEKQKSKLSMPTSDGELHIRCEEDK